MANYNCTTRTNYFEVKDAEALKSLIAKTHSGEDKISIFTRTDKETGKTLYGFGCYSSIDGIPSSEKDEKSEQLEHDLELDYELFLKELQKIVADDDAIIITEAGNEKLRCVCGYSTIITTKEVNTIDLKNVAKVAARQMLNNKDWCSIMSY